MPLIAQAVAKLRDMIDASCADEKTGIIGSTVVVVDQNGDDLFAHSAGNRGITSNEPMSPETVFWIASCTKMLAGLAYMQLAKKGALKLDDGEHHEKFCLELKAVLVLRLDGSFERKNKAITLRMLLTQKKYRFGYIFSTRGSETGPFSLASTNFQVDSCRCRFYSNPLDVEFNTEFEIGAQGRREAYTVVDAAIRKFGVGPAGRNTRLRACNVSADLHIGYIEGI
ncbi:beta-lactamase/transpeptidase-like protein [Biscogniauxia marginata]|nr:beta-lactamase/transpeptidase-like protein [Biscogniauxia marginata]